MSKSVIAVLGTTLVAIVAASLWLPVERALDTTVIGPVFLPSQVEESRYVWAWEVGPRSTINGWEHPGAWPGPFEVFWQVRWGKLIATYLALVALGVGALVALRVRDRGWNRRLVHAALSCVLVALFVAPMLYVPCRSDLRALEREPLDDGTGRYRVRPGPWVREDVPVRWRWVWARVWAEREFDENAVGLTQEDRNYNADHIEWHRVFIAQALMLLLCGGVLTLMIRIERRRRASEA